MRAGEAYRASADSIVAALKKCRFRDGSEMELDQVRKLRDTTIVFWEGKSKIDASRNTIIVWRVQPPDGVGKADGHISHRRCLAYIDIITSREMGDAFLLDSIDKLEAALEGDGWDVNFLGQADLDANSDRTTVTLEVTKLIH